MTVVTSALIGGGIYDPAEASRLVRVHPETLARWTTGKHPLVTPAFERFFDFEDLVSLLVIAQHAVGRGAADKVQRQGGQVVAGGQPGDGLAGE